MDLREVGSSERGARPERQVGRPDGLLVLEDVAGQRRSWVGADPELCDQPAGLAAGVERVEQPLRGLAVGLDRAAARERDAERLASSP